MCVGTAVCGGPNHRRGRCARHYLWPAVCDGQCCVLLRNGFVTIADVTAGVLFFSFLCQVGPVSAYFISSSLFGLAHYSDESSKVHLLRVLVLFVRVQ